ncbi:MAG: redoxin domain-containing protein [candidate division WOR-3 bacterium]|nr:MAG: redoxin domain-containing protein [candidate division WOR-3 bacterium]
MKIGDKAPDFVLKDHNTNDVLISALSGQKILLSFHPLAWTKVCAEQMQSLENNIHDFGKLNTIALGVSVDTVPSKKAWAKELGIEHTKLLSDFWPHGAAARKYGIFREKDGFSERANIIIDEKQHIVFAKIYEIAQLPDMEQILDFIRKDQ